MTAFWPWLVTTMSISHINNPKWEVLMGRGILLWLLGIPLPIVILLVLFTH
jgi:hypothetical protein